MNLFMFRVLCREAGYRTWDAVAAAILLGAWLVLAILVSRI